VSKSGKGWAESIVRGAADMRMEVIVRNRKKADYKSPMGHGSMVGGRRQIHTGEKEQSILGDAAWSKFDHPRRHRSQQQPQGCSIAGVKIQIQVEVTVSKIFLTKKDSVKRGRVVETSKTSFEWSSM